MFLTGREEIETACSLLSRCRDLLPRDSLEMAVSPLFASLPSAQQQKAFRPAATPTCRKVILATNVAETSVTIPGVSYVVDTGVVKARGFNPKVGLDMLTVQPVSKAQV